MYDETLREMEKQRRRDIEREKQEEREKAYKEATHSATFKVFDSLVGTITVIFSVAICLYFLWSNSKVLFVIIVLMLVLSFVFRKMSKHYFIVGDRKRFELYNKLAGVMGVSASLVELADYNKGKTRGAFDKMENLESSAISTYRAITEVSVTGGVYVDAKYNSYREQCIKFGKYVYLSGNYEKCTRVLNSVKEFEDKSKHMPKECLVCVNVLYMLVQDFITSAYRDADDEVVYAAIGALHYFVHPITDIPDTIPIAGYRDNMFMPLCVTGGYLEAINQYKDWKVKQAKSGELKELSHESNEIIKLMNATGKAHYENGEAKHIVDEVFKRKDNLGSMDETAITLAILMAGLVGDFFYGRYVAVDKETVYSITGALVYLLNKDDVIPDDTSITGYVDDELVILAVHGIYIKKIDDYVEWKKTQTVTSRINPLVDYLDTVIGSDATERESEIARLSAMCDNPNVVGDIQRAQYTVTELL